MVAGSWCSRAEKSVAARVVGARVARAEPGSLAPRPRSSARRSRLPRLVTLPRRGAARTGRCSRSAPCSRSRPPRPGVRLTLYGGVGGRHRAEAEPVGRAAVEGRAAVVVLVRELRRWACACSGGPPSPIERPALVQVDDERPVEVRDLRRRACDWSVGLMFGLDQSVTWSTLTMYSSISNVPAVGHVRVGHRGCRVGTGTRRGVRLARDGHAELPRAGVGAGRRIPHGEARSAVGHPAVTAVGHHDVGLPLSPASSPPSELLQATIPPPVPIMKASESPPSAPTRPNL